MEVAFDGFILKLLPPKLLPMEQKWFFFFKHLQRGRRPMPNLSYTPVSQRSMKSHKIISVPLSHPHTLENPSKFLALWKLSWRDQFIAGFRAQPNAITDFKNVCERRIKGKHMENVQYAWFQLQQKPREPGQLFVMFFVFPRNTNSARRLQLWGGSWLWVQTSFSSKSDIWDTAVFLKIWNTWSLRTY